MRFPGDKRFAFTVLDDTDVATVENVTPVYRLLEQLGLKATKTVWPVACPEGSRKYASSQTLDDPEYLAFVQDLKQRGFEIALHGATMESSKRERTQRALDLYRKVFGEDPKVHANHGHNRENLYWGVQRIDNPLLKKIYGFLSSTASGTYSGHDPASPYWWGDLCTAQITYVRNLTFREINLLRVNPSMPYRDPARPQVNWWFSTSDADNAKEFVRLLEPENVDRLEREGGVCIVSTHFGKGFAEGGAVVPAVTQRLQDLASRPGWFPAVGELLDWLRQQRGGETLPPREWRRMQWVWAKDLVEYRWRDYWSRRAADF